MMCDRLISFPLLYDLASCPWKQSETENGLLCCVGRKLYACSACDHFRILSETSECCVTVSEQDKLVVYAHSYIHFLNSLPLFI